MTKNDHLSMEMKNEEIIKKYYKNRLSYFDKYDQGIQFDSAGIYSNY
jgi:hypothetical protein